MSQQNKVPPRIHVLLSSQSDMALILCRHTSRKTAVIGWDRGADSFIVGQWLKGKIYGRRSDLSPDGRHWLYFAMSEKGQTYTALARSPYLKALDFHTKCDAWNGGGLFLSNSAYWLNDGGFPHETERHTSKMRIQRTWEKEETSQWGEDPLIYFRRLHRDGWTDQGYTAIDRQNGYQTFQKRITEEMDLLKIFHTGLNHPIGKGAYYETHSIVHKNEKTAAQYPDWEWADMDRGRLVWTEKGKIWCAFLQKNGLGTPKELFDTAPLAFRPLTAPY